MANLKADFPLCRRIARSFLQFLQSVEPSADSEALDVAKECLAEVFKIDQSSLGNLPNNDSLVDIFRSREATTPSTNTIQVREHSPSNSKGHDKAKEPCSPEIDELFGQLFGALEKIHYFRLPDGNDDQDKLDRVTDLFHSTVEEMQKAGCQGFDRQRLAEAFKSEGNKAMQSKVYPAAIEFYTFAIALLEDNAIYYCNRAAAYTQINQHAEAEQDCLKSIEIDPNYSKAYSRLGFAYLSQQKYRDAINKGFLKALQLDPNNDLVKENLRICEQKLVEEQQRSARGGQAQGNLWTNSHEQMFGVGGNTARGGDIHISPGLPQYMYDQLRNLGPDFYPQQELNGEDNVNLNVNELTEQISGVVRSMMGGIFPPTGNQHDAAAAAGNNGNTPSST